MVPVQARGRRLLARAHVWIGWLVAIPLLLWTASGLWMVARPIEEVRGEHLVAPPAPLVLPPTLVAPRTGSRAVESVAIRVRAGRPVWAVTFAQGGAAAASVASGALLPPVSREQAIAAARGHLLRPAAVVDATRTSADAPPVELRRARPAWRIAFADGARVYVDADTGGVLVLRTPQWRVFDFMWGLHILAPRGREDTSHAVLIAAAALAFVAVAVGVVLLPLARTRRRR